MIICLPADENNENSMVSPSFGRCPYYAFYDTELNKFNIMPNPAANAMGGAGIQASQFIANKGAKVALTVNMGPNSGEVLTSAGVKIIIGVTGTLRDAVERFKRGEFSEKEGRKVVFSEPKHNHPHNEISENIPPDLSKEIKSLNETIEVLSEKTKELLKRIENLENK